MLPEEGFFFTEGLFFTAGLFFADGAFFSDAAGVFFPEGAVFFFAFLLRRQKLPVLTVLFPQLFRSLPPALPIRCPVHPSKGPAGFPRRIHPPWQDNFSDWVFF